MLQEDRFLWAGSCRTNGESGNNLMEDRKEVEGPLPESQPMLGIFGFLVERGSVGRQSPKGLEMAEGRAERCFQELEGPGVHAKQPIPGG